jgi:membrane protease YdiL (CAAX protease family)
MTAGRAGSLARHGSVRAPAALAATAACLLVACLASLLVALANQPWFELVNRVIGARETVARGIVFSSWLVVVGGAIVVWRPAAFGFRLGDVRRHWRLVVGVTIAGAATTALLLRLTGATPYSDASFFIETVDVPLTEELVFRAVLLTALLVALRRFHDERTATVLAVAFNGLAFGLAHLANATSLATGFVLAQAGFAVVLGMGCAVLMARTRSVYPAMLLHAAVNAVVVVAS